MGFNLMDFFRKKGARVEQTPGFSGSNYESDLASSIEQNLVDQLEKAYPEIGNILNSYGERDAVAWARIRALADEGDELAQQLIALEGTGTSDIASPGLSYCACFKDEYGNVTQKNPYCPEHGDRE